MEDDLQAIRDTLERIENVLKVRWVIFGAIWLAILGCGAVMFLHWQALQKIQEISLQTDARSIKNEAAIDAAMQQQIAYQQQLVQYWDYLSKKNPKVKVPRVLVRPPASPYPTQPPNPSPTETPALGGIGAPLSDIQLERNNRVAKAAIVRKSSTRKIGKTPSPTPGPFERIFKPKSTR